MKKLLRGALTAGLLFSMSLPVYAVDNGSPSGDGKVTGGAEQNNGTLVIENDLTSVSGEIKNVIVATNTGNNSVSDFVAKFQNASGAVNGLVTDSNGKKLVNVAGTDNYVSLDAVTFMSDFQDIVLKDSRGNVVDSSNLTNVRMTLTYPTQLNTGDAVYVLHYSTKRQVLEVLKPESVSITTEGTSITVVFPDLSPVAVVYVPASQVGTAITTRPAVDTMTNGVVETVQNNTWFWFGGAAVVVAAVAGTVVYKKRNQE